MAAVAVEDVDLALRVGPDDELAAEGPTPWGLLSRKVRASPRQCQPLGEPLGGVPGSRVLTPWCPPSRASRPVERNLEQVIVFPL